MKSTFDSMYTFNEEKASSGKWFPVGVNDDGEEIAYLVAMAGSEKHQAAQREYAKALEKTRWLKAKNRAVMARVIAKSIFLSWRGVKDDTGAAVEPTIENRVKALIQYEELFVEILTIANDRGNFSDDDDELSKEEAAELAEMDIDDIAMTPEEESEKN
jgi:hypothetical protein